MLNTFYFQQSPIDSAAHFSIFVRPTPRKTEPTADDFGPELSNISNRTRRMPCQVVGIGPTVNNTFPINTTRFTWEASTGPFLLCVKLSLREATTY